MVVTGKGLCSGGGRAEYAGGGSGRTGSAGGVLDFLRGILVKPKDPCELSEWAE